MKKMALVLVLSLLFNCNSSAQKNKEGTNLEYQVSKTEAQWKAVLTAEQFHILREAGTERPFSSPLNKNDVKGIYHCAACDTPLFKSEYKFDSGT